MYYNLADKPALDRAAPPDSSELREEWFKSLQTLLNNNDHEAALNKIEQFISQSHQALTDPDVIKKKCAAIIYVLITNVLLINTGENTTYELEELIPALQMVGRSEAMRVWLKSLGRIYSAYSDTIKRRLSPSIQAAVKYINENYSSKISLSDIAKLVYLNSSYLSLLFKKETGMNFQKYIEMVRIEKARLLMQSGSMSISDIAGYVGFSNQNYFAKIFKQVTGTTPSSYKRSRE